MKIPLLILCVAVVYGACQTYGEENFDLTEKIENEDYKLDMPLERFLSRQRRTSLLSPITAPINMALRLAEFDTGIISTGANFVQYIFGVLTGVQECPKEKLSLSMIKTFVSHSLKMVETVLCYILYGIGAHGRALMREMFDLGMQFFRNIFLPSLYTTLNTIQNTGLLPQQISVMIKLFNFFYKIFFINEWNMSQNKI